MFTSYNSGCRLDVGGYKNSTCSILAIEQPTGHRTVNLSVHIVQPVVLQTLLDKHGCTTLTFFCLIGTTTAILTEFTWGGLSKRLPVIQFSVASKQLQTVFWIPDGVWDA
jgi:hypothetical protein